ncbi:hypothetical protein TNIN_468591 [Trichonephila inaurata madagascariensis]|uniref:Uncharacterized protein n=1 Tax=Trichonephila inaurata madagascariensis TaxID=2747483 RepID=A0A8X7CIU9_9ARAC|nr:hypothetical protein TNIN_468591 [Trichonephila inaurata madagascariensis]
MDPCVEITSFASSTSFHYTALPVKEIPPSVTELQVLPARWKYDLEEALFRGSLLFFMIWYYLYINFHSSKMAGSQYSNDLCNFTVCIDLTYLVVFLNRLLI